HEGDVCTRETTGLGIMSLLADCCAGETFARVTDRQAAYAAIVNLFTSANNGDPIASEAAKLVPVALATINLDGVPLHNLIDFRKEEQSSAGGHFIRDLRHRLLLNMEAHASRILQVKNENDREHLRCEFQLDMRDDLAALRDALRLEAFQTLGWKELGAAALAAGALATITSLHPMVMVGSTAAGAIGG